MPTEEEVLNNIDKLFPKGDKRRGDILLIYAMARCVFKEKLGNQLTEIKNKGFWKEGKMTYVIEGREYPHDETCSGSMCWCYDKANRKKKNDKI